MYKTKLTINANLSRSLSLRDVRKFKETRRQFERVREDLELAQVKHAQAPRTRPHEAEEASTALCSARRSFRHLGLDYVLQVGEGSTYTSYWVPTIHSHSLPFKMVSLPFMSLTLKPLTPSYQ